MNHSEPMGMSPIILSLGIFRKWLLVSSFTHMAISWMNDDLLMIIVGEFKEQCVYIYIYVLYHKNQINYLYDVNI